jgi:hypothetical protein
LLEYPRRQIESVQDREGSGAEAELDAGQLSQTDGHESSFMTQGKGPTAVERFERFSV